MLTQSRIVMGDAEPIPPAGILRRLFRWPTRRLQRRCKLAAVLALLVMNAAFSANSAIAEPQVDVFGQPVTPPAAASGSAGSTGAATLGTNAEPASPPASPSFLLPAPMREIIGIGIIWQSRLNAHIEDAADALRHDADPRIWLTLLLMSFAYGVLHAIGPGHGKLMVGTYLGSRNARAAQAILLCGWTATVQACSAIALVLSAAWFASTGVQNVLSHAESLEIVSYALLCLAGAWTLWTSLSRRDCCFDPNAIEFVPKQTEKKPRDRRNKEMALSNAAYNGNAISDDDIASTGIDPGLDPEIEANGSAYLGNKLSLRPREQAGRASGKTSFRFAPIANRMASGGTSARAPILQIIATGFAAGIRPCVGAIFVLVASVGAGVPWIGIAATFAMATGVAVTVTLVGLGSVGANRLFLAKTLHYRARLSAAQRILAIAGALLIVLFGAAQIALLVSGYITPSLT